MASSRTSLREDLTCAICFELFREPVMLGCMHHFCRKCIVSYWQSLRGPASCPQCRREFPNRSFQTNYLVAGVVEKVRAGSTPGSIKHLEKQLKERLESRCSLKEAYVSMIRSDTDQMEKIRRAGEELRGRVHSDFQALHHFLRVEEEAMMEELQRDMEQMLKGLEEHLEALQVSIRDLERDIHTLRHTASCADQSVLIELPELNSGPPLQELNVSLNTFRSKRIAPLQYTIWRKMFHHLNPGPAPLIFDEDTAHPSLQLSRDKTQVIESDTMVSYRCDAKRFLQCVNILATEGFQSGSHYWEVDVSNSPKWDLGVCLESVNRRARVKLCPESGYWTLRLRSGTQFSAGTQPWTPLAVATRPSRIGVFLDCEERVVSFYAAESMALLYCFSSGPRGRAFPFFSTCLSERGHKAQAMRILHFPFQREMQ
ncbi:tripartite motif containing 105 [Pimephales promelas]|uniref:tripartite motif containing 105 n=1 Tax=Pimephales promelas TaxID=90988 RepID=UPI00195588FA|nr:tripartite motif containing 105 [Pimephales promelas]XP_039509707.1 tripartite motif containing 105 [Pimephales promelas]KAG1935570.1 E3 ubiquitin-protein ligase TRIM39 [Pimephales promelas]